MKLHSDRNWNQGSLAAAIAFAGAVLILAGCGGQSFHTGLGALYPEQQMSLFTPPAEFVPVDSLQPTLKWESFPRGQDLTGSMADISRSAEDISYELVLAEVSHLDQVYRRSGLRDAYHKVETPLNPRTKYLWTIRACFRLSNERRCTQWGTLSEWEYSALWHPNFWSYRFMTPEGFATAVPPVSKAPLEEPSVSAVVPENEPEEVIERIKLRAKAEKNLSDQDLQNMIWERNFFNPQLNPGGNFPNAFVDNGDGTVTDKVTGLMWQKAGSPSEMTFDAAGKYVQDLNSSRFGGYGNWRLPTLEELCSLLKATPNKAGEFMDDLFDPSQGTCWSADENQHYILLRYRASF